MACILEWCLESFFEAKFYIINSFCGFMRKSTGDNLTNKQVNIKTLLLFMFLLFPAFSVGNVKAESHNNLTCSIETVGLAGTGDYAPFWHTSIRQGLPSFENNNGYVHITTLGKILKPRGLVLNYGIDVGSGINLQTNWFVHQLFFDVNYKWLGMELGMKERWSDKNHTLSCGALTWSGNSKPIPEIRAGIPDYVRIPFLGSWFSVKGHIGYGRMTDDMWRQSYGNGTYMDGILFHSKSAFIRFGDKERFPLQVTLGLEMNNMFGGSRHKGDNIKKMPDDAAMYWTVLFPFHPVGKQGNEDGDNIGSWHLNFDYLCDDWYISAYYEHFFEDHSSMLGVEYKNNIEGKKDFIIYGFRHNWFDGLFGFEVNSPSEIRIIHNAVFEFLNTKGQCGSILHSAGYDSDKLPVVEEVDGRDGMYNHTFYDSYTHWGYAIGNPVLISPVYNDDGYARFRSNRVQMYHLGIDGGITKKIDYRFMATTTRHWGCYGAPLKEVERVTFIMLECTYRMGNAYDWKFSLSGAMDFDSGDLLGNNRGVMLTISRQWQIM